MCGIAGYYYTSGKSVASTDAIIKILQGQRHRGPDDTGIRGFSLVDKSSDEYSADQATDIHNVAEGILGFNRLSILDLSVNGHQPMCSPDGQVILALNGEIYNAFDFKAQLIEEGFRFRSTTDTEVVLYLYLKFGFEGMVKHLNGMFAIVLIDLREQRIFFARDRFGIKPLYFFRTAEMFAFASEIKSFLPLPEFKPTLNNDLVDEYLLFRNTLNESLFKGVESLEPGTYRVYSNGSGFSTTKYFDVGGYHRQGSGGTEADSRTSLEGYLRAGVKRQLMSDVKLGCQLSGGIDSSLVTYLAKDIMQDNLLETVSITLEDQRFSEEPYIDQVATEVGVVSHKFQLDASYYLNSFDKATWHFEAPLNHPNTIGIYLLSQRAREYVTVLLSGEGADEVFGGYRRFSEVNHPYHFGTLISGLKKNSRNPLAYLGRHFSEANRAIMGSSFITPALATLLRKDFSSDQAMCRRRTLFNSLTGSAFDKQVKYEILTYLPDLLTRQDKMSMAHSIENRVPFLDNLLVEQSFSIPEGHMIGPGISERNLKLPLKKMAAGIFGDAFAFREKQGFGIPLRNFFQEPDFYAYLNDALIPGIVDRGIFNGTVARTWIRDIGKISAAELEALWILVAFEAWARAFKL